MNAKKKLETVANLDGGVSLAKHDKELQFRKTIPVDATNFPKKYYKQFCVMFADCLC